MPEEDFNPKVSRDLEEILQRSERSPLSQMLALLKDLESGKVKPTKGEFRKLAILYSKPFDGLPLCFWAQVADIASLKICPPLVVLRCQHEDPDDKSCQLGIPEEDCAGECKSYLPIKPEIADSIDCNEDCAEDFKIIRKDGGKIDD